MATVYVGMEDPAALVSRVSAKKALTLMSPCSNVTFDMTAGGAPLPFKCEGGVGVGEYVVLAAPGARVCGMLLCIKELLFRCALRKPELWRRLGCARVRPVAPRRPEGCLPAPPARTPPRASVQPS